MEAAGSSTRGSGWVPSGLASYWECRTAQSHQARPEEAQEPSWGTAKGDALTMLALHRRGQLVHREVYRAERRQRAGLERRGQVRHVQRVERGVQVCQVARRQRAQIVDVVLVETQLA